MIEYYKVFVTCDNCGHHGQLEIAKGMRVEERECPNCECKALQFDPQKED